MAESTLQSKRQNSGGEFCRKLEEANPRLVWMGPSPSEKPRVFTETCSQVGSWTNWYFWSPIRSGFRPAHGKFGQPQTIRRSRWLVRQRRLVYGRHSPSTPDGRCSLGISKIKKRGNLKVLKNPVSLDKPWVKEPEGLTPTQSWLHWMNENALRVEMV